MNEQNKTNKKAIWLIGIISLILLVLLVLLQTSNLWKNLSIETANDTITLYALSTLNFIAFIIFAFIFIRNIVKLTRESRALQLGAKLKTRLLIYLVGLSILPIIAMAGFSFLFMNRAIERWFVQIPENVVRAPAKIQTKAIEDQNAKLSETAKMLAKILEGKNTDETLLQEIVNVGNLTRIEIISKSGSVFADAENALNPEQKNELENIIRLIHIDGLNEFEEKSLIDGQGFDVAQASFADGRRLLIVTDFKSTVDVSELVGDTLLQFDLLKNKQQNVRQIGFSTLGLLTFLLIFASSWTAFYIARGLTAPIKAIAEGSDEIARGNFSHRVDVFAEDELGLLVTAFNQMSSKLEENSQELIDRRKYTETVLQSLSTGVISFNAASNVTTINNAAIQMFRLEATDFKGFTLENLLGEENRVILERLLGRAKRIGQAAEQTVLARENTDGSTETGEALPVALTATALPEENGVVLVIEDLTELISAQRASAWQEVARRMAHEIKNPLTPIQLSAERIRKNFIQNSEVKSELKLGKVIDESTETILREVSSLKGMVDEFSRFARLPDIKLEIGNLNQLITNAVPLFHDRGVSIKLDLAEDLPNVLMDEEQMRRVFANIIENSCEAVDKSNEVNTIVIRSEYYQSRELVVVEISDNGKGINPRDIQKLFQPYYSTKGRGTGLGLAIVQRIILDHGGKIVVSNNPKGGAKFSLELPLPRFA
jgi:two-component system, NtrC family, nitrogen regulation sensor histidine kinase NtrY